MGPTISSGCAARFMKHAFFMDSILSGELFLTMSVSTVPGARALTRIPFGAKTAAIERVIAMRPAFAAAYIAVQGENKKAPDETTLRMAALPEASRCGRARSTRNTGPRRLVPNDLSQASTVSSTERQSQGVGGVVHHDVEATVLPDGTVNEGIDGVDVTHVRRHAHCFGTRGAQLGLDLGTGICLAAGHHHLGSRRREPLGDGESDAASSTRHDGHAAGEVVQAAEFVFVHVLSSRRP